MITPESARLALDAGERIGRWLVDALLAHRRPGEQAALRTWAHAQRLQMAAQAIDAEFSAQMAALAAFRADWPAPQRQALVERLAAFAYANARVDALGQAAAALRGADARYLPPEVLEAAADLAQAGSGLHDLLDQLASPFHSPESFIEFVGLLLEGQDEGPAAALRQRAVHELATLKAHLREADLPARLGRLEACLQQAQPRLAGLAGATAAAAGGAA
jgi:hypothetical protein